MTPRRDPEETRLELIAAAKKLFAAKGVDGTSVSAIVKEAGVAQGTFYWHFDSKDDVLEAVADEIADRLVSVYEELAVRSDLTAVEKLTEARRALGSPFGEAGDAIRQLHQPEHRAMHERIARVNLKRLTPVVGRIIEQGVEEGDFDTAYPYEAGVFATVAAAALEDAFFEEGRIEPRMYEAYMDFVIRGLGMKDPRPWLELLEEAKQAWSAD